MNWLSREIPTKDWTARIWFVVGIILNNLTTYHGEVYFFECQAIIISFFIGMIGDSHSTIRMALMSRSISIIAALTNFNLPLCAPAGEFQLTSPKIEIV